MKNIRVLSIFDGISCARVALERAGIPVEAYYASEVDKYAMQISAKNYPDIIQLGSVVGLGYDAGQFLRDGNTLGIDYMEDIDILIGGFPCTDLSIAKKNRQGLKGEASGLFYEMIRIHKEVKPKFFIYENVASMSKENKEIILKTIQEIDPSAYVIMINAALVSAQNRNRLFFTNIPNVTQPEDKGILLKDILENGDSDRLKSYCIDANYANYAKGANWKQYIEKGRRQLIRIGSLNSVGLSALGGGGGAKTWLYAVASNGKKIVIEKEGLLVLGERRTELGKQSRKEIRESTGRDSTLRSKDHKEYFARDGIKANCITTGLGMEGTIVEDYQIRKLTTTECERLMGLDDGYTSGVSNSQRYKMLGNSFHIDVIAHIMSFIKGIDNKLEKNTI